MPFHKATTAGTKALTCIYSESGGGKTLSALLIARGLVGPSGRIAMIDTENRRGELYADDRRIGGYDVLQLGEPFSPAHYIEAIEEAEAAGYDAIVVDSISHEWEGIGGVCDMAAQLAEKRFNRNSYNQGKEWDGTISFGDWKEPKTQHKHLIQKLMRCKAHVIVCARAQYKSRQIEAKDYEKFGITSRAKTTVIRDTMQSPIQEDRFIFEMTVHLQMSNEHPGVPIITKCPDMLLAAFKPGEQISVATGERMASFYNNGAPTSDRALQITQAARDAAAKGTEAYRNFFSGIAPADRLELSNTGEHERLKLEAQKVDDQRRALEDDPARDPELENDNDLFNDDED